MRDEIGRQDQIIHLHEIARLVENYKRTGSIEMLNKAIDTTIGII
jgi:hypothetical protein